MITKDIIKFIETWAPPGVAWERDNVGLQIGDLRSEVNKILLSLDLNESVVDYAIKIKAEMIFTHHPFFFITLKKIDLANNPKARIIKKLLENNISLYSAHTNLDFTKEGVSFQIAKKLGLENIRFLKNIENNQYKLIVFVPEEYKTKVAEAIFEAGGGIIGEYEKCSFELNGVGTFQGSENSNPKIGSRNNFERVNEVRLEVLVDEWKIKQVISALLKAHPYEEPAYDIYALKNKNVNYGEGALGEFKKAIPKSEFLKLVSEKLKVPALRFSNGNSNRIKRVAVCGGTCSSLVYDAISAKADAFITADVKYHEFQDAEGKILFVDAGHYETEVVVLNEVKKRLELFATKSGEKLSVVKFRGNVNPMKIFIK
jgi:dinuclear metal center YbgI/SA1388 family protein